MLAFSSENGFSYLYKNALDLTFLLSVEPGDRYRFVSANKSYFDITKLKETEVIGKYSEEILKAETIAMHQKYKEAIALKEPVRYEESIYLFTKLFVFETTLTPIFNESGACTYLQGVAKDITEKKSLETQLRNSNANLKALIENTGDAIWSVDKNYHLLSANSKFYKGSELFYGAAVGIGENILAMASPEMKRVWIDLYSKAFNGIQFNAEQRYNINGTSIYVEVSMYPIPIEKGQVTSVLVLSRNITKRKLAEKKSEELMLSTSELNKDLLEREAQLKKALHNLSISNQEIAKSEEYFRALIRNSSDLITIVEKDGTIRYKSPSFYKITGSTEKEVIGKSLYDFIHESDREEFERSFNECLKNNGIAAPVEFKIKKLDGNYIIVEAICNNCLHNNDIEGIIINSRDVTVRKELEAALQKSTKAALDILQSAPFPIVLSTANGSILYSNDRAEELFKVSIAESQNKELKSHSFYVDLMDREKILMIVKEQGFVNDFEMRMKDSNGNIFYALSSVKTIYYEDQLCLISFINNITGRKIAEEKLKEKNIELEKTNKELDRFVYSASHDLRSPITSVLGLITIATSETNDPQQHYYFDLMNKSLLRLDQFIKEIIQYSRNSRLGLKIDAVDFQKLVTDSIESLQFMEGANKIEYIINIKQPVAFFSDQSRIIALLNNLVSNAIKYHNYNQERLYIELAIEVTLHQAIISIKDNGKGLKKENIEKIFDMFYVVAENNAGTGIGLYIVKETMNKLGGEISVESEYGKGSNFIMEVPNQPPLN